MSDLYCAPEVWWSLAKDSIFAGAAILAGYVGWQGLHTWRRQLKGNTEYELAKAMLKAIYELRDAIASVRNPFMQYPRDPDVSEEELARMSDREKRWQALAQAYQNRWEAIPRAKSALEAVLLEAEVVWGRKVVEKVLPLNGLLSELHWSILDYLEAQNPNAHYERPSAEEVKERRSNMYAMGDLEKDKFRKRLQDIIGEVENEVKPHILQYHQ